MGVFTIEDLLLSLIHIKMKSLFGILLLICALHNAFAAKSEEGQFLHLHSCLNLQFVKFICSSLIRTVSL